MYAKRARERESLGTILSATIRDRKNVHQDTTLQLSLGIRLLELN